MALPLESIEQTKSFPFAHLRDGNPITPDRSRRRLRPGPGDEELAEDRAPGSHARGEADVEASARRGVGARLEAVVGSCERMMGSRPWSGRGRERDFRARLSMDGSAISAILSSLTATSGGRCPLGGGIGDYLVAGLGLARMRDIFQEALQKVALVGPSYKRLAPQAVRGPMLKAEVKSVRDDISTFRGPVERFGTTVVSDGATDGSRRPIINLLDVNGEIVEFVKAIDCTGLTKNKEYIAKLVVDYIKGLEDPRRVVQVLMDNATRGSWPLIEAECPWLVVGPCEPHVGSLEVKDICNLPFFKEVKRKVAVVRRFILSHQKPLAVFKSLASGMLHAPAGTRMGTTYYEFQDVIKQKDAIAGAMGSREVQEYVIANKTQRATPESSTLLELYTEAKTFATDIELYQRIELAQAVLQPIVMCIRLSDSDRPTASKIQYTKYQVQEKLKTVTVEAGKEPWAEGEYDWDAIMQEVIAIHRYRWDYGYTIVQGTGYLLDPEYVDMDQHQDPETMEAFRSFVEKCYVFPDALPEEATEAEMLAHEKERDEVMRQRAACDLQLLEYKMKRGVFARDVVWENAKNISAVDFWFLYGNCVR
ncbi:hypothetical protein CYMTET_50856 [Cymbomonas tetramitiformis]|uniref:DUF659 domain-containing protein n=1 Tax=Cymbomonas tetramitiformis TaxID=36881 RepID=A0AAE0BMF7_9CHLO|nr:hypothetical protein CYMTET_50856 [Cymbomonas tetramitiformis]